MKVQFDVDTVVQVVHLTDNPKVQEGDVGIVVGGYEGLVYVDWKKDVQGTSYGGLCPNGQGWTVIPDWISPYEFSVGERVVYIGQYSKDCISVGDKGTIVNIGRGVVSVAWDKELDRGHSCGGLAEEGHGWAVFIQDIFPAEYLLGDSPSNFDSTGFELLIDYIFRD